jgi:hypothetical protein
MRHPNDEREIERQRRAMARLAEEILRGDVGVLDGARRMLQFGSTAGLGEFDPDLITFVEIDSREDHLPIGRVRQLWDAEALARKDKEITEAEAFHCPAAFAACDSLIRRFGAG